MRPAKSLKFVLMSIFSLTYLFFGLFYAATGQAASPPKEGHHTIQLMFVQNAKGVEFKNNQMTLKGISPSTIYFSDRPERITGHMTQAAFLKEWNLGKDSFRKDPPNATLSIFNQQGPQDVVVELSNPVLKGENLTYDVKVLMGDPPAQGGVSTLFIDWVTYGFGYRPYWYGPRPYYYGPPRPYFGPGAGGCHRNWYTGAAYCYRPGYWQY